MPLRWYTPLNRSIAVRSIERVTTTVADIAHASEEQSAGSEQVDSAIVDMDQVTRQNAALVEEAAGAESMQEQAARLAQVVSTFRLDEVGITPASQLALAAV